MQVWDANLIVTTHGKNWEENVEDVTHSYNDTEFEAEDISKAEKKLLIWVKKKLRRFKPGKDRFVFILAAPKLKNGDLDGNSMLRNRESRYTIPSILRGGVKKVLVRGYGPEAAEERARKV
jgi:hypothetical protein